MGMLQNAYTPHKPYKYLKWGVPGGTTKNGENARMTLTRELREELHFDIEDASIDVQYLGTIYVRNPLPGKTLDYTLFVHGIKLDDPLNIILSDEHIAYRWCTFDEMMELDLMSQNRNLNVLLQSEIIQL